MFGGKDFEEAFCDLWAWSPIQKLWSSPLAVGR